MFSTSSFTSDRVQFLECQIRDKDNPGLNPVLPCWPNASSFPLHCSSYMNEYLAITSGRYLYINSLLAAWLNISQGG